jgi:CheY-like chemotaxis protein
MGSSAALRPDSQFDDLTILVVEDHRDSRDALRQFLEYLGARVLTAENGLEALALLHRAPDVVLCDLRMPHMDGFGFLERLRRDPTHARIPVIAVTAFGAKADLLQTYVAGFAAHLTKPIDPDALVSTLTKVRQSRAPRRPRRR